MESKSKSNNTIQHKQPPPAPKQLLSSFFFYFFPSSPLPPTPSLSISTLEPSLRRKRHMPFFDTGIVCGAFLYGKCFLWHYSILWAQPICISSTNIVSEYMQKNISILSVIQDLRAMRGRLCPYLSYFSNILDFLIFFSKFFDNFFKSRRYIAFWWLTVTPVAMAIFIIGLPIVLDLIAEWCLTIDFKKRCPARLSLAQTR